MEYPDEFARTFNWLKKHAKESMLLRYGSVEACELIVRAKLAEINALCDGEDYDVVFLAVGSIVADYVMRVR
jgi:hypothetical protein